MNPLAPMFLSLSSWKGQSQSPELARTRRSSRFANRDSSQEKMSVISGGRSLLTARVTREGVVLEVTREKVLSLMAKDTELGEILMGAFVARRLLMIELGEGNVILLGTNSSARTLALREFLTRNGPPFTYIDIETDSFVGEL